MGYASRIYASRIYVVNKNQTALPGEKRFGDVIVMFNLQKMGDFRDIFDKETDCFIYADDGNIMIFEDKYGKPLTEAPLKKVIEYLEDENKTDHTYRRILPTIRLLKGFDIRQWQDLVVLHYGY